MKVTYIEHSGFLVEGEHSYLLFDYFKGDIPQLSQEKSLYVFASHEHGDHFNPEIFRLLNQYPLTYFILSSDISLKEGKWNVLGLNENIMKHIMVVRPEETKELPRTETSSLETIILTTLKSTDRGVAFLMEYEGQCIYHAGDLNWWVWNGDTKQEYNNMTANFKREINKLKGKEIDLAFVPLDSRQEDLYYLGMDYLLRTAHVRVAFPMHFWDDSSVIQRFKNEKFAKDYGTDIKDVTEDGQSWIV